MQRILLLVLSCLFIFTVAAYSQASRNIPNNPKSPDGGGIPVSQVPNVISYQGLLTTSSGAPATDGTYSLKFDLFSDTTAGFSYWTETQANVVVQRGTFHVALGSVNTLPSYIFSYPLFVQVTATAGPGISSSIIFSPRTPMTSSAYSLALRLPFASAVNQPSPGFDIWNYGTGAALSGSNYYGSSSGTGVSGYSFGGYGMYGLSPNGTGMYGRTQTNSNSMFQYGVYGLKNNSLGLGVSTGTAILGESDSSYGVSGLSIASGGVLGFTYNGYGVFAQSFGTGYSLYASGGPLAVVTTPGDASVQLPNDAIDSQEMLDEPGVAAKYFNGFFFTSNTTLNQSVDSVTISVPAAGKIVVQSSGYMNFNHTNGTDENMAFNILNSPAGNILVSGISSFNIPASAPTSSTSRQPFANLRIFDAPSAGTYKFYLVLAEFSASTPGGNNIGFPAIVATYYPTTYGSTPTEAPQITDRQQDGSATTARPASTVPYQTAEEYKAAKTRDLNQKVLKLESQIKKLEQTLQQIMPGREQK